ncbi:glycosyltransferase [Paenibacillus sp. 481]|uniref:glycosyltransferase n=1 Tax=Paenibacillus sp. 481 TaxID=2835869 RepID=UPI001E5CDF14|nr:glycosyltransferase family A protein [Paenibacillus sp. 481]UHA75479.1 glycosyltransferase family 2 protein [Paenibacillus sp. 481]
MTTSSHWSPSGVSIITCTNRARYMKNVFHNYDKQTWKHKELIIILNNDDMNVHTYKQMAKRYAHVSVYQLPEKTSLGSCLNFGVFKTKYNYIAKFDDDDFYSTSYLADSMDALWRSKADVVGKKSFYCWLGGRKLLILRSPGADHKYVSILPGATLVFRKRVFEHVRFANISVGEDDQFCRDSRAKGYTLYSGGKYNFTAIRRKNASGHTWKITEQRLLHKNVKIVYGVRRFKRYVSR